MSDALGAIHKRLAEYQASPKGYGVSLRHDVSGLIVQRLEVLGWSQRDLARALGKPESFVSRLIHHNANCELETVGAVLHALGIKPFIGARETVATSGTSATLERASETDGGTYGKEIVESTADRPDVYLATETIA